MTFRDRHKIPDLGVGVGFRIPHYGRVHGDHPPMDWFEVISENFMVEGGRALDNLARLKSHYRVIPHGVSLAIGSVEPLDGDYLSKLKTLLDRRLDPPWVSDHLCWARAPGVHIHDLLPLPYTREAIDHVVERTKRVQGTLERPFALENVSSYMTFRESTMTEWDFLAEIAERADCGILLDCNNVYVSAKNHGFDPMTYIDAVPADRVVQMHLAGHTDKGKYVLDTHSDHVIDEVWALYKRAIERCGPVSTLVEWDEDIPEWDVLSAEAAKARTMRAEVLAERSSPSSRGKGAEPTSTLSAGSLVRSFVRSFVHSLGTMSSLATAQTTLADVLRRTTKLANDPELTKSADAIATGNDRLSPVEQVDIYREQFWLRHIDVLREDFASIEHVLGDDAFEDLARAYLTSCPSASFTLRDLGIDMTRFLSTHAPWKDDPFLAALSRVEWAFVDAFDGPDAPPFDPTTIAGVAEEAWPTATIVIHPSLQRITLDYPAHDYRIAVKKARDEQQDTHVEPAEHAEHSEQELTRPAARSCNVVVYRGAELLHCLEIDNDANAMLDELAKGTALGEACERASATSGTTLEAFQTKLASWFSEWTALGWIRAVRFKS